MEDVSYDWLRLVEKALVKMQQLPPLEESFPFPWADASEAVGKALGLEQFNLSAMKTVWKGPGEVMEGMSKPLIVSIEISPIEGSLFFVMSESDVSHFVSQALTMEKKDSFSHAKLTEGFYYFSLLKAVQAIDDLKLFKDVSFHLAPVTVVPQENSLCVDIACALSEKTLRGRLVCPHSFLTAFKAYQPLQKSTLLASEKIQDIEVVLRCEVGHTHLGADEWEKIQVGDFVVLERCSYDPREGKGSVTLLLGDTPLVVARIKPEGMKVLDYAFYREEPQQTGAAELLLTAEIGSVRIPLNKLVHFQPGSMIDLSMRPEQGLDILLEGKKVAKGELLKLGETSGFRILDIER